MTPTAELIYNHDYALRLYRGAAPFKEVWQDLVNRGEVFERVFHEAAPAILAVIPSVTGYDWATTGILPIYMAADGANLVAPLTLTATNDIEQMLYDLIGLLIRTNVPTGFPSEVRRDAAIHAMSREVIRRNHLNLEDAIAAADLELREQHGLDFQVAPWDLHAKPARHYLAS